MPKKGCCRECKYADGCTCMIDGKSVDNASDYTCDRYLPAKPMTNADRIRQMTDEELAEFIAQRRTCDTCCITLTRCITTAHCKDGVLAWLRKEADEDAGTD